MPIPDSVVFRVRWKGYSEADDTFEPLENLDGHKMHRFVTCTGERTCGYPHPTIINTTTVNLQISTSHKHKLYGKLRNPRQYQLFIHDESSNNPTKGQSSPSTTTFTANEWKSKLSSTWGAEPEPESEIDENDPDKDFKRQLAAFRRIFSGLPWPPITVETPPRDAVFQTEFKFIDRPVLHDAVVSQKDKAEFMLRCHCGPGGCKIEPDGSSNCECVIEAKNIGHGIPFDPDGRISVNLKSTAVWVCNHLCSCGPECLTKASSLGRPAKLKIKWTGAKGWGVFLDQDEPIPPRTFISRYVGEIITTEEAERRGREYDRRGTTYLFDMDCNSENEALFTIDAQRMGNESHFFNHSCRPNLQVYNLFGEYANVYLMTPSFWTIRTIRKGDELTFDYNGHYQASWLRNSDDRTSESEDEEENDKFLFHANGNHNQSTQKQRQAPHSKGKRRRQVDSEDDYYDDMSSTSSGGHMSANGDTQQANVTAAASSPRPIQRPSSPTHKGTRNPVDRTRAARKRSSGAHLSAATPAIVARLPAKYATGSSSGGGGGRRQPSVDGSTLRIPCHCGEKNCRKFVHMPRTID
ncbi:Eukaryotic translation initiation factor 2 subunit 3 [Actinomortierella wolfii]|nr:Eukaryotic translation initiation factor 2 subunit 3 [Actinomortierella wolfii]